MNFAVNLAAMVVFLVCILAISCLRCDCVIVFMPWVEVVQIYAFLGQKAIYSMFHMELPRSASWKRFLELPEALLGSFIFKLLEHLSSKF